VQVVRERPWSSRSLSVNSSSVGLRPKIDVSSAVVASSRWKLLADFEGDADRATVLLDGALQSLTDPPGGVRGEF